MKAAEQNVPHTPSEHSQRRRRRTRVRTTGWVAVVGILTATGSMVPATIADAVTGYHVVVGSAGLNARSGPGTGYSIVGHLSNGQAIDISCQTKGTLVGVGLPGIPTDVWDRLANGWYITDYYTSTPGVGGAYTPGIPQCGVTPTPPPPPAPHQIYNRTAAKSWALDNWNNANGSRLFAHGDDCTYFVSQALWVGGIPKTPDWTNSSIDITKLASRSWIPGPTKTATLADAFKNYVVNNHIATIKEVSWSDNTAGGAQLGDIIGYDWDGPANGILDHLAIVTALNMQGTPFVSQHTLPQVDRNWAWSAEKKTWIRFAKPGSRVYLIHVIM